MKYAKVRFKDSPQDYIYICSDDVKPGNVAKVYSCEYFDYKEVLVLETMDELPKNFQKKFDLGYIHNVISTTPQNTVFDEKGRYSFIPKYEVYSEWHKAPLWNHDIEEGAHPFSHIEFKKPKFRGSLEVFKWSNSEHGLIEISVDDLRNDDSEYHDFWANEEHFSSIEELNYKLNNLQNAIYYYYIGKIDGNKLEEVCYHPDKQFDLN